MSNYGYCGFDFDNLNTSSYNNANTANTATASNFGTNNLDNIIENLNLDNLTDALTNNLNNPNNCFNYCDFFNILLCYGSQFINLIYVILFLYWWSNQSIYCFLMNQNCQLTNGINDVLQQCLDNCCR